jgi:hypothetical protein
MSPLVAMVRTIWRQDGSRKSKAQGSARCGQPSLSHACGAGALLAPTCGAFPEGLESPELTEANALLVETA